MVPSGATRMASESRRWFSTAGLVLKAVLMPRYWTPCEFFSSVVPVFVAPTV